MSVLLHVTIKKKKKLGTRVIYAGICSMAPLWLIESFKVRIETWDGDLITTLFLFYLELFHAIEQIIGMDFLCDYLFVFVAHAVAIDSQKNSIIFSSSLRLDDLVYLFPKHNNRDHAKHNCT